MKTQCCFTADPSADVTKRDNKSMLFCRRQKEHVNYQQVKLSITASYLGAYMYANKHVYVPLVLLLTVIFVNFHNQLPINKTHVINVKCELHQICVKQGVFIGRTLRTMRRA